MINKKGQEGMSTATIIGLILGVVLLVVLVLGFTIGWNKVFPFLFSSNNVDTIKTSCDAACATNNEYGYCTQERTLKAEDLPAENGQQLKEKKESCKFFATDDNYQQYSISDCSSITCP